jgi:hypothetical protein
MNAQRCSPLLLFGLMSFTTPAQETMRSSALIVHGEGFMFSVDEPKGWQGDTGIAKTYYSDIVFYPSGADPKNDPLIQVALFKKDENTEKDLSFDVKSYTDEYPDLQKEVFRADHKDYRVFAKLVFVKGDFHHYLAYVNPGERYSSGFSVAMNISGRAATDDELEAYRKIIASLWMMGVN